MEELNANEGCRVTGKVEVNRIPGNIHFSFHEYQNIYQQLKQNGIKNIDVSHTIVSFDFDEGSTKEARIVKKKFRDTSKENPLDMTSMLGDDNNSFVYYLNVVRTVYNGAGQKNYTLNQYTVNKYKSKTQDNNVPIVFLQYDIAPIYVYYSFRSNSVMTFMVRIIAIIGGVITVAGILVALLQNSVYHITKSIKE